MNHREGVASLDVSRNWMPEEFHYQNWNNAALKGNLVITSDSILLFGNIGVWVSDSAFINYRSLNKGFPKGTDNRKVFDLHKSKDGNLYAATQSGLYAYDVMTKGWEKIDLNADIKRFVAIESVGDTLYVLNRSYLYKGLSKGVDSKLSKVQLKQPPFYKNQVSLFETIWQIHSGEIFGLPGRLFVDLLGVVTIVLSVTGIIFFFFPGWIKRRKWKQNNTSNLIKINKWSLKWHNKTGAWLFVPLILLFFTGMFLRPPLLIAIAKAKIAPIKYSHLDQCNPWYDKLRDLKYDADKDLFLLATSEGMFHFNMEDLAPVPFEIQPPVSVMGINVLEPFKNGSYIIGSFSGLFLWHPSHPEVYNYAQGKLHKEQNSGRPIGDYKITGLINSPDHQQYMVDYDKGIIPLYHEKEFPAMPDNVIKKSKMSLWNLCLEIHTGRFFRFLLSDFYILLVPLSGLVSILVVMSGYLLWKKRKK